MKPVRCRSENLARHGVRENEVRECLASRHLRSRNPAGGKGTYLVVGKTAAGRYLEIVFEERGDCRWVFHAMTARERLARLFRRRMQQHGHKEN